MSATVKGFAQDANGNLLYGAKVYFNPVTKPVMTGANSSTVCNFRGVVAVSAAANAGIPGLYSAVLVTGIYIVTIDDVQFKINVPNDNGTYWIGALVITGTSGGGTPVIPSPAAPFTPATIPDLRLIGSASTNRFAMVYDSGDDLGNIATFWMWDPNMSDPDNGVTRVRPGDFVSVGMWKRN